jgi:hypothetical protein
MRFARSVRGLLLVCALATAGCQRPYRVGEHVLVEWEEGKLYPAYVIEVKGSRYRVHFEGYDARWDEEIGLDRIKGRATEGMTPPPPPAKVLGANAPTTGASAKAAAAGINPFKVGDRVRVTWRGSVYAATVVEISGKDRIKVHYEGHESAWDEVVSVERVLSRRP